jgi:hypothetical protein
MKSSERHKAMKGVKFMTPDIPDRRQDHPSVVGREDSTHLVPRGQVLRSAGLGALGALAAIHSAPITAHAGVLSRTGVLGADGSWHVSVQVDGVPGTFDTLYSFAPGGVFVRVDGSNNAPGLGQWKTRGKHDIVFAFVVFSISLSGQRAGTITALCRATINGDSLTGSFSATGVDPNGAALAGFPKTGAFQGSRIQAQGPQVKNPSSTTSNERKRE